MGWHLKALDAHCKASRAGPWALMTPGMMLGDLSSSLGALQLFQVCGAMNFRMHFTGHVFSWEFTGVAAPACLSPAGIQLLARLPGPDALLFLVGKVPRISTFFLMVFLPVGHFPDLVQILWPHFPVVFTSLLPSLEGSYKGKRDYLQEY